jgi:guanosine-3',5'-bis(diphosphate) 3'-pyrophosphohydrolase
MSGTDPTNLQQILAAAHFAALKHRRQRRKGGDADPYVNHVIAVAELLARVAAVTDLATLQAALLHDTLEDTEATRAELDQLFGQEVRRLVEEVTDNKQLLQAERKRLQVEHAPHLSPRAKLIKLADKTANISEISLTEPVGWSLERKREYLAWAEEVVGRLGNVNAPLRALFDRTAQEKRRALG